jgi:excisionase family DNA binding protein
MLNVHQAAERLGVSKWTIWRLVRQNRIPYYRWHRGALRFDGFELELWKQQHQGGPQPARRKVNMRDITR